MDKQYWSELFDLDAISGSLIYKERPRYMFKTDQSFKRWNSRYVGGKAGALHDNGTGNYKRINIQIQKKSYKAHRIIAVMCGIIDSYKDEKEIDHIDGNPVNNRPENLRATNRLQNGRNQKLHSTNKTKISGVFTQKDRSGWIAQIYCGNQRKIYLGCFNNLFEAACARKSKELELNYFKNHGLIRQPPQGEG